VSPHGLLMIFISACVAANHFVYNILRPPFDDQFHIVQSQCLISEKPLGTGCCEWLWSIAMWANGTLPYHRYTLNFPFRSRIPPVVHADAFI